MVLKKVKIRKADDGLPKEFLREVESLKYVVHPNVIQIREVFVVKTNFNIVYELMECDLDKVLGKIDRPISLNEVN